MDLGDSTESIPAGLQLVVGDSADDDGDLGIRMPQPVHGPRGHL